MIKSAAAHHVHLLQFKKRRLVELGILLIAVLVLLPQAKQFSGSWKYLSGANPVWLLTGVLAMFITILFAALVYMVLVPGKLPFWRTILIQLATYFTNRLLPGGLGGIGFNALYLVRQAKLSRTDAAVYATANNLIGFVAFSVCIGASSLISGSHIESSVPLKKYLLGAVVVLVALAVVSFAFKKVQRKIVDFAGHLFGVVLAMIRHPKRMAAAILLSMGITASYAAVLWASANSVGIHLSLIDLFIAFVAGNTALTLSPTPGGIGAVEAAITGVVVSAGVSPSLALAGVVIFRIISYWLPVLPGFISYKIAVSRKYV